MLLDLHLQDVERYFSEHRNKQKQTAIGDAIGDYADELDIIVYKKKQSKFDLRRGSKILVVTNFRGNANKFSRRFRT